MSDEDTVESQYLSSNVHPFFAMENSTSIILGGIKIDTLNSLYDNDDLAELNIEESLVQLIIPIGNKETRVTIDGQIIMNEGVFQN